MQTMRTMQTMQRDNKQAQFLFCFGDRRLPFCWWKTRPVVHCPLILSRLSGRPRTCLGRSRYEKVCCDMPVTLHYPMINSKTSNRSMVSNALATMEGGSTLGVEILEAASIISKPSRATMVLPMEFQNRRAVDSMVG